MYQVALRDLYSWGKLLFLRGNKNCARGLVLKIVLYVVFKTLNQMKKKKKNYPQNNTNVPKNEHFFFCPSWFPCNVHLFSKTL
jgi:hypothetical protein